MLVNFVCRGSSGTGCVTPSLRFEIKAVLSATFLHEECFSSLVLLWTFSLGYFVGVIDIPNPLSILLIFAPQTNVYNNNKKRAHFIMKNASVLYLALLLMFFDHEVGVE